MGRQRILTAALKFLGPHYVTGMLALEVLGATFACALWVVVANAYLDLNEREFLRFLIFCEAVSLFSCAIFCRRVFKAMRPLRKWLAGNHSEQLIRDAWRVAFATPLRMIGRSFLMQFVLIGLPISIYAHFALSLSLIDSAVVFVGTMLAVSYSLMLSYFGQELGMRPVVSAMIKELPSDLMKMPRRVLSLRWKLLAGIPLINIFTGYVVSVIASQGQGGFLGLGSDALIAVAIAALISLELTVLLSRSILVPINELIRATYRVAAGEFDVRVPVASNDEMGALARSYNEMIEGLSERERLREAFSTYVDRDFASRVLNEGESIAGEEVDVTVMFADIRGFTAMASRATPAEVVGLLNRFFECVVPIIDQHGGHANKFVGDGMMAVFGVPERYDDHADRALRAACAIKLALRERFGEHFKVGLGLNSGPVVAGSVGGGGKLEFTVIGDVVNVASRVEQFTRETEDSVLLTRATYDVLKSQSGLVARQSLTVKGKDEPIEVFSVSELSQVA